MATALVLLMLALMGIVAVFVIAREARARDARRALHPEFRPPRPALRRAS